MSKCNCNCDFLKKIKLKNFKNINKNTIFIAIAVIAIVITGVLIFAKNNTNFTFPSLFGKSSNQIGKDVVDYINNNQLSSTPAELVSVSSTSGVIKVKIKIGEQEFDSYATKDGKLLFPQAFEMIPAEEIKSADDTNSAPTTVTKNDSPMLEAYVVSRCPYGLQMQRAMADAIKNIPELSKYIKARYIGSVSGNTITAMHGEAEAKENLRQICIREEQPTKYWNYVSCDMKAGDSIGCEKSTGIDSAKLSACISDPSRGVAYAKVDFDLSDNNNVQGSPTLILNGTTISESGYGGRSSDGVKSMVCAGFNSEASFCSTELNKTTAAFSFSATYASASGNTNDASCN